MFKARKKIHFSLIFLWCCFTMTWVHAQNWQKIEPGLEYLKIDQSSFSQWSHIHVFRVDLSQYQFNIILAKNLPSNYSSAKVYQKHSQGWIALNGGFFSPNMHPLGLRISDSNVLNPLKLISWWGIFSIENHKAAISSLRQFKKIRTPDFAIQAGPRLLVNGHIPHLRPGLANRSVLAIDAQGRVLILVTENLPISTSDLAEILQKSPINAQDALNLDGGSSSQIYAKTEHFVLDVPGFNQVSDAVVLKPMT